MGKNKEEKSKKVEVNNDYFLDLDDKMLEYIEKESHFAIDELVTANNSNKRMAQYLFNLLLTGVGATFLLAINNISLSINSKIALSLLMVLWGGIACYLWWYTIKPSQRVGLWHTPIDLYTSLYKSEFTEYTDYFESKIPKNKPSKLDVMRRYALVSNCKLHNNLTKRNTCKAKHLSYSMVATVLSPVVVSIGLAISVYF